MPVTNIYEGGTVLSSPAQASACGLELVAKISFPPDQSLEVSRCPLRKFVRVALRSQIQHSVS